MKYWRGYLVAAILAFFAWGLREFARTHSVLVDMVYPYVTRMAQTFLADWSSSVDYCIWQVLLVLLLVLIVASAVLMIVLKWNVIQWFGWVCAVAGLVVFLQTGIYGLNEFAGPLADDIQLEVTDYTATELEKAADYFRDQAIKLSDKVKRDSDGNVVFADFDTLAVQAAEGFDNLVYDQSLSVFAGSMVPVKKLGWPEQFADWKISGVMVGLTGEAAVNSEIPQIMLPFTICREMAKRMCIAIPRDANFGAYLACMANPNVQFQYSGALMGYRYCLKALETLPDADGDAMAARVKAVENSKLAQDIAQCDAFLGEDKEEDIEVSSLMTSWHIQNVVLPALKEEENVFNPFDKSQVDLSGLPHVKENTDE